MSFSLQSATLSRSRRDFLRDAAGLVLGSTFLRSPLARAAALPSKKKVVVITFGGGARDQETFAPEGQENIPQLMRELIPQATFFTQVVNRGILGHYVATAAKPFSAFGRSQPLMPGAVVMLQARRGAGPWRNVGPSPIVGGGRYQHNGVRLQHGHAVRLRWAYLGGSFRRWLPAHSRVVTVVAP